MACADGGGPDREKRGGLRPELVWKGYRGEGKRGDTSEYARLPGYIGGGGVRATEAGRGMEPGQEQSVTRGERSSRLGFACI